MFISDGNLKKVILSIEVDAIDERVGDDLFDSGKVNFPEPKFMVVASDSVPVGDPDKGGKECEFEIVRRVS